MDRAPLLVEAALGVLAKQGPAGLSLRAVARAAGVSPAAPYRYFRDKEALVAAVAAHGWRRLDAALQGASETGSVEAGELGVAYVRFARDNPALYRVMSELARERDLDDSLAVSRRLSGADAAAGEIEAAQALAGAATWCLLHGLAEICRSAKFRRLADARGGQDACVRAILQRAGLARPTRGVTT